MAGDWIKFELSTLDKPETIRIGRALGISREAVCGWLARFWGWAGANSVDGYVDGMALRDIDMVMGLPGFADALVSVGWLKEDAENRVFVPKFERHNGESSKKRALTSRRQENWRNAHVDGHVDAPALPEKRREEKNLKPKAMRSQGSRLPVDWGPTPELKAWAIAKRPDLDMPETFANFRDYWATATKNAIKLDWDAAFRVWVRGQRIVGKPTLQPVASNRPSITCSDCKQKAFTWTSGRCDQCWRKSQGLAA